eukprot:TRINITY_DN5447_c0_g4_i1.p1 TRINITY_DN5447_c0_g4~~TRINITY_DN5447_c0_g4_i1.p1  ORF type:complete len:128 (+),score=2.81 TRINITY_DN5447_c0_g4_i1:295-678(+)
MIREATSEDTVLRRLNTPYLSVEGAQRGGWMMGDDMLKTATFRESSARDVDDMENGILLIWCEHSFSAFRPLNGAIDRARLHFSRASPITSPRLRTSPNKADPLASVSMSEKPHGDCGGALHSPHLC